MKYRSKIYLPAYLLLAACLSGCIGEKMTGEPDSDGKPIFFISPTGKAPGTRALPGHPVDNVPGTPGAGMIPDGKSFGVYAWEKASPGDPADNFAELQNTEVTRDGSEYTYDPIAKWPREQGATLSFFGYYPHSSSADAGGRIAATRGAGVNQWLKIAYTVPADAGAHIDLMYARTAMTTGYDPVNLDFRHALARLKFEGRTDGYPGGTNIKITGIKVTGALLKGELVVLDPVTQPGKPWWELDGAVTGDMTIPAAHIEDVALTQTLQALIPVGGDMLVLPQQVSGLSVEITVSQDGTAYPGPVVLELDGTPDWTMNEIFTYEITVRPEGVSIASRTDDWTTDPVNVIYDGQYYMDLNYDRLELYKDGGDITLEINTNYDKINTESGTAGCYLDVSGLESWVTVTDLGQTLSGGEYTRRVRIEAPAFAGAADQTPCRFIVKAGNLNYVFHLTQSKDSWLTANVQSMYLMDGQIHSLTVSSSFDWTVAVTAGNEPVNGKTALRHLLTESGTSGADIPVNFQTYDALSIGDTELGTKYITLTFTEESGLYTEEVQITLIDQHFIRLSPNTFNVTGFGPKTVSYAIESSLPFDLLTGTVINNANGIIQSATVNTGTGQLDVVLDRAQLSARVGTIQVSGQGKTATADLSRVATSPYEYANGAWYSIHYSAPLINIRNGIAACPANSTLPQSEGEAIILINNFYLPASSSIITWVGADRSWYANSYWVVTGRSNWPGMGIQSVSDHEETIHPYRCFVRTNIDD